MKKVNVKKLLTLALAICLTFTAAYAFAPMATITAKAAGKITNPTAIQPNSNTDFSGAWNNISANDHNCYKVVLPADGLFSVTLMAKNTESMQINVRKAQTLDSSSYITGATVFCDLPESPATKTETPILSAGTYFITVENHWCKGQSQYKLKTTYESFGISETPDSYDSPKALVPGKTYTDAITKTDAEDWYKVNIPENGKYSLKVSTFHNTVNFTLKDADLKGIASHLCFKTTETEEIFLKAGTYYLHMNGAPSKYSFSLSKAKISQTSIKKVKAIKNKKVDVTFKNVNDVNGYQIRYSTDKNFKKNVKTKTFVFHKAKMVNGNKRTYTISKLKKNKKYYFQVRTYLVRCNTKYYSDWSKTKNVKVK